ncbi:MAG: LysR family transcriptional regulator [bacterium]|nr:MAG: LysR family transcriptional regulator [bacterium]
MRKKREHRPHRLIPRMKLWLSSSEDEGVFGDGKWRLLEAIKRESSLKAAAQSLHISYRKAWGDLKKAEECLGLQFIEKHRGGDHGGETILTDEGRRWLTAYSRFRSELHDALQETFENHIATLFSGDQDD